MAISTSPHIVWLDALGHEDRTWVGPRHLRLGESVVQLAQLGIRAPAGFVFTARACAKLLTESGLAAHIRNHVSCLRRGPRDDASFAAASEVLQRRLARLEFPAALRADLREAYSALAARRGTPGPLILSTALLSGSLGTQRLPAVERRVIPAPDPEMLVAAVRECLGPLVSARMLAWRAAHPDDALLLLSVAVRELPRADQGAAGTLYTFDPAHGFRGALTITAHWGLPADLAGSRVQPDRYRVFRALLHRGDLLPILSRERGGKKQKVTLDDRGMPTSTETSRSERLALVLQNDELLQLARWGDMLARQYDRPLVCEWLRDGVSGEFFISHVRPAPLPIRPGPSRVRAGPPPRRPLLLQTANPREAFACQSLPLAGAGPVRLAAVVGNVIGMPLMSLLRSGGGQGKARRRVERVTAGYGSRTEFLLEHLVNALAQLAAAFYPRQVIVQLSGDHREAPTQPEFGGGDLSEAASAGRSAAERTTFALELQAVRRTRDEVGLQNLQVMLPESDSLEGLQNWIVALHDAETAGSETPLALHAPVRAGLEIEALEALAAVCDTLWIDARDLPEAGAGSAEPSLCEVIERIHAQHARVGIWGAALSDTAALEQALSHDVDAISVAPGELAPALEHLRMSNG